MYLICVSIRSGFGHSFKKDITNFLPVETNYNNHYYYKLYIWPKHKCSPNFSFNIYLYVVISVFVISDSKDVTVNNGNQLHIYLFVIFCTIKCTTINNTASPADARPFPEYSFLACQHDLNKLFFVLCAICTQLYIL